MSPDAEVFEDAGIIPAQMAICKHCKLPIANVVDQGWLHGHSQKKECTPDPRTNPPT